MIIEVLTDAVVDSAAILPLLFAIYLIIEFAEHKTSGGLLRLLRGKLSGVFCGAALGCLPQCGVSVASADLFSKRLITSGALVAVFIATSDEALPLLLAEPEHFPDVAALIVLKLIVAVAAGLAVNMLVPEKLTAIADSEPSEEEREHEHSILICALKRTLSIFMLVFVFNLILGAVLAFVPLNELKNVLHSGSPLWIPLAAVVGFIPNCAASILLTGLYTQGVISFGALFAGHCTGAGAGLAVLIRENRRVRSTALICAFVLAAALVSGTLIDIIV